MRRPALPQLPPRWQNHPAVRAIRSRPLLGSITLVAVLIVVARQSLLTTAELFPGGAAIGEALFGLSMAMLAAWIFNLIVVDTPRMRAEQLILAKEQPRLRGAASDALTVVRELNRAAGGVPLPEPLSDPLTQEQVQAICSAVKVAQVAPNMVQFFPDGTRRPATWPEYLQDGTQRAARRHQQLETAFVFLPLDLVVVLRDLAAHPYSGQIGILNTAPASNPDLGFLSTILYSYLQQCHTLETYLKEKVDPLLDP